MSQKGTVLLTHVASQGDVEWDDCISGTIAPGPIVPLLQETRRGFPSPTCPLNVSGKSFMHVGVMVL